MGLAAIDDEDLFYMCTNNHYLSTHQHSLISPFFSLTPSHCPMCLITSIRIASVPSSCFSSRRNCGGLQAKVRYMHTRTQWRNYNHIRIRYKQTVPCCRLIIEQRGEKAKRKQEARRMVVSITKEHNDQ